MYLNGNPVGVQAATTVPDDIALEMNIMGANWRRYWDLKDKFVEKAKDINSGVGIIKQSNENTDVENHANND